jgi:hypothetical protein
MAITRPQPIWTGTLPERVEERGAVIIPSQAQESAYLRVMAQLTVDDANSYKNFKSHQPEGFYGYAQVVQNRAVVERIPLQYGIQVLATYDNSAAQIIANGHCQTLNLNQNADVYYRAIDGTIGPTCRNPLGPTVNVEPIQPPYLPRVPWDEIWVAIVGRATVSIWVEFREIDYICDDARGRWTSRDSDRGTNPGLPNPSGQGNNGSPDGGGDTGLLAPPVGNGRGDQAPFDPPGTRYQIYWRRSGQNASCVPYRSGLDSVGPVYDTPPTITVVKNGTAGDNSVACGFTNERHVLLKANGSTIGNANGFGLTIETEIRRVT